MAFANLVRGVQLDDAHQYVGGLWALLNPFALLGGLTTLVLFLLHGSVFVALKTDGEIRTRARRFAGVLSVVALARGRRSGPAGRRSRSRSPGRGRS